MRAYVLGGGGPDYHDQDDGHWINDHIATPLSKYPEYRQSCRSFKINVLGTLVVEIEDSAGNIGFAVTTGGEPPLISSRSTWRASSRARRSPISKRSGTRCTSHPITTAARAW